jgi:hypothetical protein
MMTCYDTCCRPEKDEDEVEYTVISRRSPRATRTEHRCVYCGQPIPVGSAAYVTNVLGGGRVYTDYRHRVCPEEAY